MYQWRETKNVIQINLIHVYLHKLFIVYLSLRLIKTNGYVNLIWIQTQRHGHADIWTLFFSSLKYSIHVFVHSYSRWYPNANAAQGQCQVLTNELQETLHDKMNCSCVNHDSRYRPRLDDSAVKVKGIWCLSVCGLCIHVQRHGT